MNETTNKDAERGALIAVQWEAALPPPAVLAQYERVHAGFAERLLRMAEDEAAHLQRMERMAIEAEARDVKRSTYCALAIGCVALVGGTVSAIMGAELAGGLIGGGGVVGLVTAFILGRRAGRRG